MRSRVLWQPPDQPPQLANPGPLTARETAELDAAIERVHLLYPGLVGEMVARDLRRFRDVGHRLSGDDGLARRVVRDVLKASP